MKFVKCDHSGECIEQYFSMLFFPPVGWGGGETKCGAAFFKIIKGRASSLLSMKFSACKP